MTSILRPNLLQTSIRPQSAGVLAGPVLHAIRASVDVQGGLKNADLIDVMVYMLAVSKPLIRHPI